MKRVYSRITEQSHTFGVVPGALLAQYANTQTYPGLVQMFTVLVVGFATSYKDWFALYLPWIDSFWKFLGVLLLGYLILNYFDYRFIQPSRVIYGNRQSYAHENPVKADFEEVKAELREIKALIHGDINLM